MTTATLLLGAALAWSTEPGITCQLLSPQQVSAMSRDTLAEGEFRLSLYGDVVPSAAVYELRHGPEGPEARIVRQVLEHGCIAYTREAQCPRLGEAMDAARALATMAEREPPQPWPWVGMQTPAHYTEWGMQYGRAHGPAGTARWIDPLPPRTHPAIGLIGRINDVLADCVDVGRSARRAGARADKVHRAP